MPRPKTILQNEYSYHIYARCINRQWFDLPIREVWDIVQDYLYLLHHGFGFSIHAFTLMNNHFHGLIKTPRSNLGEGMNHFMREVSRCISERSGRINQTFGGPYKWCIVDSDKYFLNAYKYIYRNPVEAGLSARCEMYPYSALHGLLGQSRLAIPIQADDILFTPELNVETLKWLNTGKHADFIEVQNALKKKRFRFEKCRSSGLFVRAENFVF